jgi:hypothetical protein
MAVQTKTAMVLLTQTQLASTDQFGLLPTELTHSWVIQPNGLIQMATDMVMNQCLQLKEMLVHLLLEPHLKIGSDALTQTVMGIQMEI